jgi:hypothetical protein
MWRYEPCNSETFIKNMLGLSNSFRCDSHLMLNQCQGGVKIYWFWGSFKYKMLVNNVDDVAS